MRHDDARGGFVAHAVKLLVDDHLAHQTVRLLALEVEHGRDDVERHRVVLRGELEQVGAHRLLLESARHHREDGILVAWQERPHLEAEDEIARRLPLAVQHASRRRHDVVANVLRRAVERLARSYRRDGQRFVGARRRIELAVGHLREHAAHQVHGFRSSRLMCMWKGSVDDARASPARRSARGAQLRHALARLADATAHVQLAEARLRLGEEPHAEGGEAELRHGAVEEICVLMSICEMFSWRWT